MNLNNANDKRLTEHPENDQVLFAMPQFEITSYTEFPETWYNLLEKNEREAYDKLWVKEIKEMEKVKKGNDEAKDEAKEELNIRKNMFKRTHDIKDGYEETEETEKQAKREAWEEEYKQKLKKGKEVVPENIFISRHRPFHIFEVKQVSYKQQYTDYKLDLNQLNLLCVLG